MVMLRFFASLRNPCLLRAFWEIDDACRAALRLFCLFELMLWLHSRCLTRIPTSGQKISERFCRRIPAVKSTVHGVLNVLMISLRLPVCAARLNLRRAVPGSLSPKPNKNSNTTKRLFVVCVIALTCCLAPRDAFAWNGCGGHVWGCSGSGSPPPPPTGNWQAWAIWALGIAVNVAVDEISKQQARAPPATSQPIQQPIRKIQPRAIRPPHEPIVSTSPPPQHIRSGTFETVPADMRAAEPAVASDTWGSIAVAPFSPSNVIPSTVPLTPFDWKIASLIGDQKGASIPSSPPDLPPPGTFTSIPTAPSPQINPPSEKLALTNSDHPAAPTIPLEPFRWPAPADGFISLPTAALIDTLQPSPNPVFTPQIDTRPYCDGLNNRIQQLNDAALYASLAQDVYTFYEKNDDPFAWQGQWNAPQGFKLVNDVHELQKMFPGMEVQDIKNLLALDKSGYRAGIYRRDGKIVLAFRGSTDEREDWATNKKNNIGIWTDYFKRAGALGLALKIYADRHQLELEITGHSLGGGLAIEAAMMARTKATVFNAETLDIGTLSSRRRQIMEGLLSRLKFEPTVTATDVDTTPDELRSDQWVANYTTPLEPLTLAQLVFPLGSAPGRHISLSDWPDSPRAISVCATTVARTAAFALPALLKLPALQSCLDTLKERHAIRSVRLAIANQIQLLRRNQSDFKCSQN